jgi:tryptophan-rich sensory protein
MRAMELLGNVGWPAIAAAVAGTVVLIVLGAVSTELGAWYYALKQPPWKPADFWFGPVWTTIFTLSAWAGLRAWGAAADDSARQAVITAFVLNGILNIAWSLIFFKLRRPDWAVAEVVLLWLSIVLLMVVCARHDGLAPWLLLPYLVWVGFAGWLNLAVVRLNAPF